MNKHTLARAQKKLKALGLYAGYADGIYGRKTKNAVRKFQTMHNLSSDGILGRNTLRELFPTKIKSRSGSTNREVFKRFGPVGENQTRIKLPYPMKLAWDLSKTVKTMTLHELIAESAQTAFKEIACAYTPEEIVRHGFDLFGGSLNVRRIRGGRRYSLHSWGIAIDIDPARNRLKWKSNKSNLAIQECDNFWEIWEANGWHSLGREKNFDWMHVQAVKP